MFPQKPGGAPNTFNGGERKFDLGLYIQNFWMPALLASISESNSNKYHTLVEELDINLDPFHDPKYREELATLKKERAEQNKNPDKYNGTASIERRFYQTWRRLLMNLMARENMMRQEDGVLDET